MKKNYLAITMGIMITMAALVTGCSGTASGGTTSTTATEQSASEAGSKAGAQSDQDASAQPGSKSGSESAGTDDAGTQNKEIVTVQPSEYAGQTVSGEITAVDGQNITVALSENTDDGTQKQMTITVTDDVAISSGKS